LALKRKGGSEFETRTSHTVTCIKKNTIDKTQSESKANTVTKPSQKSNQSQQIKTLWNPWKFQQHYVAT